MGTIDSFDRSISVGDTIWIPAKVSGISNGVLTCQVQNTDGSYSSVTQNGGTSGQTTNPAEGDRPPR